MSGTYQLSEYNSPTMALFPHNPISKRWTPNRIATRGDRSPIFSAVWQLELGFGTLETLAESSFFETRFRQGGQYHAVLPHPDTGQLTGFTGVAIEDYQYELGDIDADYWALNPRLVLSVNLTATGTV